MTSLEQTKGLVKQSKTCQLDLILCSRSFVVVIVVAVIIRQTRPHDYAHLLKAHQQVSLEQRVIFLFLLTI